MMLLDGRGGYGDGDGDGDGTTMGLTAVPIAAITITITNATLSERHPDCIAANQSVFKKKKYHIMQL